MHERLSIEEGGGGGGEGEAKVIWRHKELGPLEWLLSKGGASVRSALMTLLTHEALFVTGYADFAECNGKKTQ